MLMTALIVFTIAALGGLLLASFVLRDKFAPWIVSLLHAALGATGLVLLLVMAINGSFGQRLLISLALFLVAALGGFFLASFHLRKKLPPKAIVILHASLAVAGFLVLLSMAL